MNSNKVTLTRNKCELLKIYLSFPLLINIEAYLIFEIRYRLSNDTPCVLELPLRAVILVKHSVNNKDDNMQYYQ